MFQCMAWVSRGGWRLLEVLLIILEMECDHRKQCNAYYIDFVIKVGFMEMEVEPFFLKWHGTWTKLQLIV